MSKLLNLFRSKVIVTVFTVIIDCLIATGQLDPALKELLLKLVTALGALYVSVEGARDLVVSILNKLKPNTP